MSSASMRAINSPRARRTASFNRHASPRDLSMANDTNARIAKCGRARRAVVARSIVDEDKLPVGQRLPNDRTNCGVQGSRAIAHRHDYRYNWNWREINQVMSPPGISTDRASANSKSTFAVKETSWKARCSKRPVATHAPGNSYASRRSARQKSLRWANSPPVARNELRTRRKAIPRRCCSTSFRSRSELIAHGCLRRSPAISSARCRIGAKRAS